MYRLFCHAGCGRGLEGRNDVLIANYDLYRHVVLDERHDPIWPRRLQFRIFQVKGYWVLPYKIGFLADENGVFVLLVQWICREFLFSRTQMTRFFLMVDYAHPVLRRRSYSWSTIRTRSVKTGSVRRKNKALSWTTPLVSSLSVWPIYPTISADGELLRP